MNRYITKFPAMQMFRSSGRPRVLPVNLAYSLTHSCNSRCKTCGLGGLPPASGELETAEWLRVFESLGRAPLWITITGGEPFMRPDLLELCRGMFRIARPKVVTFATNGSFTERASLMLPLLAREFPDTSIVVNISLDGIGPEHDRIRGLKGSFEAAMETFNLLKLNCPHNLYAGFHTTISRHNIDAISDIIIYTRGFKPDGHMFEIAQQRAELKVVDSEIAPPADKFRALAPKLAATARGEGKPDATKIARYVFREQYYLLSAAAIKNAAQPIPCYAGYASAQISPAGDVWACCVEGRSMGNLRDVAFDFGKIWKSRRADEVREGINRGDCHCAMANAMITSLMFYPRNAAQLAGSFISCAASELRPFAGSRR